ncbi:MULTISPECIES: DUF6150 family protein [Persicobacter]|uniref:7(1) septoil knot domain-containing protein n=1 Tax=Persicobacter diffluens TaxID=981 RepID=A0AAN4VYU4_9BACT|nr:DUF6150 family protein [Persicobacter sp. CCB-QB2]GJM62273.1 hypothetical protein PEDI_28250 [Persicobacter diffluens]
MNSFKAFFLSLGVLLIFSATESVAQYVNPCQLMGKVFEVEDERFAQYLVYEEEYESSADLVVFEEDNWLYCTKPGMWCFVDEQKGAHFNVAFVEERSRAHFTVFFTDAESFAGCNR